MIELDNCTNATRLELQLEDGEVDDCLKIYTNYVRRDDGCGDFHYDLYFNIQNLFNSPFEYISSITKQPNVLIIPDSYLYLSGGKYKRVGNHNEIDPKQVDAIKRGGELSIYGQVKTYSDDVLCGAKTIKLFTYRIHNISDDKPKFLIQKTYDITKSTISSDISNNIEIEFSDVMWTLEEDQFEVDDEFKTLEKDIEVVQPVHVRYNWRKDDDYRINSITFDIVNDVIDFNNTPELLKYHRHARTLRDRNETENNHPPYHPYYDRWSDKYMALEFDKETGIPRMTLNWDADAGYNFETIYLRWRLPKGFKVMDTMDRLMGYVFSSTAQNIEINGNSNLASNHVDLKIGHVVARVPEKEKAKMYLGLEHSTTRRTAGYVLSGLADQLRLALNANRNPTLTNAIPEHEIIEKTKSKQQ